MLRLDCSFVRLALGGIVDKASIAARARAQSREKERRGDAGGCGGGGGLSHSGCAGLSHSCPRPGRSFVRLALGGMVDEESIARAQECCYVKTLAVQVGEGAAVLRGCAADVYITSEMSHSDVLAANAQVRQPKGRGLCGILFCLFLFFSLAVQVGEGAAVLRGCAADVYVTSQMAYSDVLAANKQFSRSPFHTPSAPLHIPSQLIHTLICLTTPPRTFSGHSRSYPHPSFPNAGHHRAADWPVHDRARIHASLASRARARIRRFGLFRQSSLLKRGCQPPRCGLIALAVPPARVLSTSIDANALSVV